MPDKHQRIRGFLGEQSFEITEGFELLDRVTEALVFGNAYRVERKLGIPPQEARWSAQEAVRQFRKEP